MATAAFQLPLPTASEPVSQPCLPSIDLSATDHQRDRPSRQRPSARPTIASAMGGSTKPPLTKDALLLTKNSTAPLQYAPLRASLAGASLALRWHTDAHAQRFALHWLSASRFTGSALRASLAQRFALRWLALRWLAGCGSKPGHSSNNRAFSPSTKAENSNNSHTNRRAG